MAKARARVAVKVVDRGWDELRKTLDALRNRKAYVKAGVLGGDKAARPGEALTNVELALIHEYGAPSRHIPERSFIRSTFDAHREEYFALLRQLLQAVYANKLTVERALGLLGARMSADIKKRVTTGAEVPPPNAPSTLARKLAKTRKGSTGSVRTLIDTGRLIGSVAWAVVLPGRSGAANDDGGAHG
jgi:hypothetical protein